MIDLLRLLIYEILCATEGIKQIPKRARIRRPIRCFYRKGPVDGTARTGEKKPLCERSLSACRKSGICSLSRCAAAGTAWNIFSTGLSGEDDINSSLSSSTTENNNFCSLPSSYNCSTSLLRDIPWRKPENESLSRVLLAVVRATILGASRLPSQTCMRVQPPNANNDLGQRVSTNTLAPSSTFSCILVSRRIISDLYQPPKLKTQIKCAKNIVRYPNS